jgi:hypothetical protein
MAGRMPLAELPHFKDPIARAFGGDSGGWCVQEEVASVKVCALYVDYIKAGQFISMHPNVE